MKTFVFFLSLAFSLTTHAQSATDVAGRSALFRLYVNIKEVSSEPRDDITIRDITFSPRPGREVKAYLVVPQGNGPFAAVLWVHWLGDDKSNRTQFLEEAVALAPKGTVSLLVDAMWSAPQWFSKRIPDNDYQTQSARLSNSDAPSIYCSHNL